MIEWDVKDDYYWWVCECVCVFEYYICIDLLVFVIGIVVCDGNRFGVGVVYCW